MNVNYDKKRGLRFTEVLENIFEQGLSNVQIAKQLGCSDPSIGSYRRGKTIQFDVLRNLAERGGDVNYILTGKKSAAQKAVKLPDNAVAREPSKMLQILKLLADIEAESQLDAESWEGWQSCLQSLEHELLDAQKMFARAHNKRSRKNAQSAG